MYKYRYAYVLILAQVQNLDTRTSKSVHTSYIQQYTQCYSISFFISRGDRLLTQLDTILPLGPARPFPGISPLRISTTHAHKKLTPYIPTTVLGPFLSSPSPPPDHPLIHPTLQPISRRTDNVHKPTRQRPFTPTKR